MLKEGRFAEWQYDALPAQREFHGDLAARFKGYSGTRLVPASPMHWYTRRCFSVE